MGFSATDISLSLPKPTLLGNDFGGELFVPAVRISARDADGYATLVVPSVTLNTEATAGELWSLAKSLPAIDLSSSVVVGNFATASISVRGATLSATGSAASYAQIVVPAISLLGQGEEVISWSGSLVAPSILVSSGGGSRFLGGVSSNDYVVWLVNQETKAHSTYANWQANSWGVFNGSEFIATPDGIFELVGDDDAEVPIEAKLYWVPSNLGTSKQKRIDAAYVKIRGDRSPIRVVSWCDETQKRVYTKDMTLFPQHLHPARVLFTRNLSGQLWQIGFENVDGGDFDLAEIEIVPIILSRRLK